MYACACVRVCRVWYTYTAPKQQQQQQWRRRRRRCSRCMLAENEKEEIKSKEAKNRLCQLHSARLLSLSLSRSLTCSAAVLLALLLLSLHASLPCDVCAAATPKTCFVEFRVDYFTLLAAASTATAALRLLLALCQLTFNITVVVVVVVLTSLAKNQLV